MNVKNKGTLVVCISWISILLSSCSSCQETNWIKNCTRDTLLIELTVSDTIDDWLYWDENPKDTLWMHLPEDTTVIYVNGEKTVIINTHYVLPDSFLLTGIIYTNYTYYIHAINWHIATQYTLEEIRARKLYDTQTVTKKDFRTRLFEYKSTGSKGDH